MQTIAEDNVLQILSFLNMKEWYALAKTSKYFANFFYAQKHLWQHIPCEFFKSPLQSILNHPGYKKWATSMVYSQVHAAHVLQTIPTITKMQIMQVDGKINKEEPVQQISHLVLQYVHFEALPIVLKWQWSSLKHVELQLYSDPTTMQLLHNMLNQVETIDAYHTNMDSDTLLLPLAGKFVGASISNELPMPYLHLFLTKAHRLQRLRLKYEQIHEIQWNRASPKLKILTLTSSRIATSNALAMLPQSLTVLQVETQEMQIKCLQGLEHIQEMDLQVHLLQDELQSDSLLHMTNLRKLRLKLKQYTCSKYVLQLPDSVEMLNTSVNMAYEAAKLESVTISFPIGETFMKSKLPNLKNLVGIVVETGFAFQLPNHITSLKLLLIEKTNCLPAMTNLTYLDLTHSKSTKLFESAFAIPTLQTLIVNSCKLSTIPSLDKMPELHTLSVQDNQLTSLPDLSCATKLRRLISGENKLHKTLDKQLQALQISKEALEPQLLNFIFEEFFYMYKYYIDEYAMGISDLNLDFVMKGHGDCWFVGFSFMYAALCRISAYKGKNTCVAVDALCKAVQPQLVVDTYVHNKVRQELRNSDNYKALPPRP